MLIDLEGIKHIPDANPNLKYGAAVKLWLKDLQTFVTAHSESGWGAVLRIVNTSVRDFWQDHTQYLPTRTAVTSLLEWIFAEAMGSRPLPSPGTTVAIWGPPTPSTSSGATACPVFLRRTR